MSILLPDNWKSISPNVDSLNKSLDDVINLLRKEHFTDKQNIFTCITVACINVVLRLNLHLWRYNLNKTCDFRKFKTFHYNYFLNIYFRFQTCACNGCHNLLQGLTSFKETANVSVKRNSYRIWSISWHKAAVSLLKKLI